MDHIITNTFLQAEVSSCIFKAEISSRFPVFATMKLTKIENKISASLVRTRKSNGSSIDSFRSILKIIGWD